jgi:branched-chain amino acid transport system substrate-binding protein
MPLPGIMINTGPFDFAPIKHMQMQRFNGLTWELFGPIQDGALISLLPAKQRRDSPPA